VADESFRADGLTARLRASQAHLDRLRQSRPWLRQLCLCTRDGKTMAEASADSGLDAVAAAKLHGALLALCQSFAEKAFQSIPEHSLVATARGCIVAVRMPCASGTFILGVLADSSEPIGLTLRESLDAAKDLAAILDTGDAAGQSG